MTENANPLDALRAKSIADIKAVLLDLPRADVVSLLALEGDQADPRETLTKLLSARIAAIDAADGEELHEADAGDRPTVKPAWQRADYSGPLDIEQATWRNANLKPVDAVILK